MSATAQELADLTDLSVARVQDLLPEPGAREPRRNLPAAINHRSRLPATPCPGPAAFANAYRLLTMRSEGLRHRQVRSRVASAVRIAGPTQGIRSLETPLDYLFEYSNMSRSCHRLRAKLGSHSAKSRPATELSQGGSPGAFWRDDHATRPWPGRLRSCSRPGLACSSGSPPRGRWAA